MRSRSASCYHKKQSARQPAVTRYLAGQDFLIQNQRTCKRAITTYQYRKCRMIGHWYMTCWRWLVGGGSNKVEVRFQSRRPTQYFCTYVLTKYCNSILEILLAALYQHHEDSPSCHVFPCIRRICSRRRRGDYYPRIRNYQSLQMYLAHHVSL